MSQKDSLTEAEVRAEERKKEIEALRKRVDELNPSEAQAIFNKELLGILEDILDLL